MSLGQGLIFESWFTNILKQYALLSVAAFLLIKIQKTAQVRTVSRSAPAISTGIRCLMTYKNLIDWFVDGNKRFHVSCSYILTVISTLYYIKFCLWHHSPFTPLCCRAMYKYFACCFFVADNRCRAVFPIFIISSAMENVYIIVVISNLGHENLLCN